MTSRLPLVLSLALATFGLACSSSPDSENATSGSEIQQGSKSQDDTVSGRIILSGDMTGVTFPLTGKVSVIDVSKADAPSVEIGSQTISVTGPEPTAFTIPVSGIDAKAQYAVQVRVDTDGDGATSKGDFLNQESFPILNEHGSVIDVTAQRY